MKKILIKNKKVGETPLQVLENLRVEFPELKDTPLTYAGRLDPMAEGKLLVLIGKECKKKDKYIGLDKEYEFEILLGVKSDTGDILGLAQTCSEKFVYKSERLKEVAKKTVGEKELPYPSFSSKTVDGKPLWQYALQGDMDEVAIPIKKSRVFSMKYVGVEKISAQNLLKNIENKVSLLQTNPSDTRLGSNFRKEEILMNWKNILETDKREFVIAKFKAVVSSGTYIRSLASAMADSLGTCGLAYSINRTKIGKYSRILGLIETK